jgi:DMSO/TMAO reductase YedYZ molybdopterin-dependent catalytic subunit
VKRQLFLASSISAIAGCAGISNKLNDNPTIHKIIGSAQGLDHAVIGTRGRARLYSERDIDRNFRTNGFDTPSDATYGGLARDGFARYALAVDGEVERPHHFSLAQLRALASLRQITRHDCVEGWSAIGEWNGVPLARFLALVRPTARARYVVFHCFDRAPDGTPYYESLDIVEAAHPQTLLALDLNGKPLDPAHGAPVRLRIPTQLGYKSAKWIKRIQLAARLEGIFGGGGGYWEDNGYEWYAGI